MELQRAEHARRRERERPSTARCSAGRGRRLRHRRGRLHDVPPPRLRRLPRAARPRPARASGRDGASVGFEDAVAWLVPMAERPHPEATPPTGASPSPSTTPTRPPNARRARRHGPDAALRRPLGPADGPARPAGRRVHREQVRAPELTRGPAPRACQAASRRWNQSTVRLTASRCGVGSNGPKAPWNFDASETKGRSNW